MESSTLPSSSPLRFPSTDIPDDESVGHDLPRTPRQNENGLNMLEDGEVHDERSPPGNQQQSRVWHAIETPHEHRNPEDEHDPHPTRFSAPSLRKRYWGGSQDSEERARSMRRPRHCEAGPREPSQVTLPPIAEFLSNPWSGMNASNLTQRELSHPMASSMPYERRERGSDRSFTARSRYSIDSRANVSGQAPTPHNGTPLSLETNKSPLLCRVDECGRNTEKLTRAAEWVAQTDEEGMRVDEDDAESSALLQAPAGSRTRKHGEQADNLRDVLADPAQRLQTTGHPDSSMQWRGGYAPRYWDQDARDSNGRRRVPAVEDWSARASQDADDATYLPIPHTKAWQYQQDQLRNRVRDPRDGDEEGVPRHTPSLNRAVSPAGYRRQAAEHEGAATHAYARSEAPGGTHAFSTQDGMRRENWQQETSCDRRGRTQDDIFMDEGADWRDYGMLPTAVTRAPRDEGVPTLAEDPKNERWNVHFDDAERLVSGQSARWQQELWPDASSVIFAAYNYKYTSNGHVNRHVENAVTVIVKYVTVEDDFYVVPPHPDPTRELSARDLPFTWGIRGLTPRGAAKMTDIRIASSQGVSIITYSKRLSNPKWVLGLVGFLRPDAKVIAEAVLEVLQEPRTLEWIAHMAGSNRNLRAIPSDERVDFILSTLEVKIAQLDQSDFMANIYMEPPTDDMADFRVWAAHLHTREYNNFRNGIGKASPVYYCGGCRGVDHDTMKCTIPDMKGWQGTSQGASSHTTEMINTKREARGGRSDQGPGSGTWEGGVRGGRGRGAGAGQYGRGGRGGPGRGANGRMHTPAGQEKWHGGRQPTQQRNRYLQQWMDDTRGEWRM